jgi:hypothetical protein
MVLRKKSLLSLIRWFRTFCDTTMYTYVSEIFPTDIRPIGMGKCSIPSTQQTLLTKNITGFSLFGQFDAFLILLQTAPIGFVTIGWRYYLVIIICSLVFLPIIYFYFPETARLSLEEVSAKFGDEVAVDLGNGKELDDVVQTEVSDGANRATELEM